MSEGAVLRQSLAWKTLDSEIRQLFREGFLEFRTPPDAGPDDPLLAETLLQLDGDLLVFVDPAAFDRPELLAEHHRQVRGFQLRWRAFLGSWEGVYKGLAWVSWVGGPAWGIWLWVDQGLGRALVWFLTPLVPTVLKKLVTFAAMIYLRRRVQTLEH